MPTSYYFDSSGFDAFLWTAGVAVYKEMVYSLKITKYLKFGLSAYKSHDLTVYVEYNIIA
jgi:hypothetical protein